MTAASPASITIGSREVGDGRACFVIAELSGNHAQDLGRAIALVHAAADAGADAVKLQCYTPDTLTIRSDEPWFRIGGGTPWDGASLYDLYAGAMTPWEWYPELASVAEDLGLVCFASAFDRSSIDALVEFGAPALKIASFECNDVELVRHAALAGKPLLLSTGMATFEEIDRAVRVAREAGAASIGLFRCNSAYPASPAEMHLRTITDMSSIWGVPVGLSDHTLDATAAVVAVALGACMVEKHLTLARSDGGPDAAFSLEPEEFGSFVRAIRDAEAALGHVSYGASPSEQPSLVFRRSLFVVSDVQAGERFTRENVRSIRPGFGLAPVHLDDVVGQCAARDVCAGTPMSWDLVAGAIGHVTQHAQDALRAASVDSP